MKKASSVFSKVAPVTKDSLGGAIPLRPSDVNTEHIVTGVNSDYERIRAMATLRGQTFALAVCEYFSLFPAEGATSFTIPIDQDDIDVAELANTYCINNQKSPSLEEVMDTMYLLDTISARKVPLAGKFQYLLSLIQRLSAESRTRLTTVYDDLVNNHPHNEACDLSLRKPHFYSGFEAIDEDTNDPCVLFFKLQDLYESSLLEACNPEAAEAEKPRVAVVEELVGGKEAAEAAVRLLNRNYHGIQVMTIDEVGNVPKDVNIYLQLGEICEDYYENNMEAPFCYATPTAKFLSSSYGVKSNLVVDHRSTSSALGGLNFNKATSTTSSEKAIPKVLESTFNLMLFNRKSFLDPVMRRLDPIPEEIFIKATEGEETKPEPAPSAPPLQEMIQKSRGTGYSYQTSDSAYGMSGSDNQLKPKSSIYPDLKPQSQSGDGRQEDMSSGRFAFCPREIPKEENNESPLIAYTMVFDKFSPDVKLALNSIRHNKEEFAALEEVLSLMFRGGPTFKIAGDDRLWYCRDAMSFRKSFTNSEFSAVRSRFVDGGSREAYFSAMYQKVCTRCRRGPLCGLTVTAMVIQQQVSTIYERGGILYSNQ